MTVNVVVYHAYVSGMLLCTWERCRPGIGQGQL